MRIGEGKGWFCRRNISLESTLLNYENRGGQSEITCKRFVKAGGNEEYIHNSFSMNNNVEELIEIQISEQLYLKTCRTFVCKTIICIFCCVALVGTWSRNTFHREHKRKTPHWPKHDSSPGAFWGMPAVCKPLHNKNRKRCRPPSPQKARGDGWVRLAIYWSLCWRWWSSEWSRSISSSPHKQGLNE